MTTYNTIVESNEINVLNDAVKRCPYECVKLDENKYGFMDNANGDIRNYFCDTLGYESSNYEAFDFEYFDEPINLDPEIYLFASKIASSLNKRITFTYNKKQKRIEYVIMRPNDENIQLGFDFHETNRKELIFMADIYVKSEDRWFILTKNIDNTYTLQENMIDGDIINYIKDYESNLDTCISSLLKEISTKKSSTKEPQNVEPSKQNHKTHLQGLGEVPAIKAGELKEGDIIVCNYGYTQTVTRIIKETAKSIFVEIRSDESGKLYETRYLKSRLIAIKERESITLPEPPKEIDITDVLDEMKAKEEVKPVKLYNTTFGVGTAKYVVNFHDGIKRHKDGSRFYDIRIFSNKKEMGKFIKELEKDGYKLDAFFNESESEKETNQESDRIAFSKASKAFIEEWRTNNPYPGSDYLDEFNAKFNREYSDFVEKWAKENGTQISSYMFPNPYPIERGEYKETALDRQKKSADILVESIDGNWYTIRLNRQIELKSKRIKRYDNGCIAVPESVYTKLQGKYNVMCNF